MENFEHSFPLPETETHKLDEVKEVLEHPQEQGVSGVQAFVQSNPWWAVGLAGVGGFCLGFWLKWQD